MTTPAVPGGEVLVYEAPDGGVRVEVKLDRDTVWLTQRQMSELFDTTPENVLMHLKSIYANGELEEPATAKDFLAVRLEGKRQVKRQLKHYNLDAIISVGYRVNSRRGVRFRQWVTQTLRDHLVRGYTLNQQRFEHNARELEAALALVRKAAAGETLSTDQGRGLVDVIARYTQTFLLLQRYDEGLLVEPKGITGGVLPPVTEARSAIARLKRDLMARGEATDLLGREREDGLAALTWLERAGWRVRNGAEIAPGEPAAEREDYGQVVLAQRLRENVRAQLRVLVKRILRRHGYPPDKQEKATETVLEQAALLSGEWAAA